MITDYLRTNYLINTNYHLKKTDFPVLRITFLMYDAPYPCLHHPSELDKSLSLSLMQQKALSRVHMSTSTSTSSSSFPSYSSSSSFLGSSNSSSSSSSTSRHDQLPSASASYDRPLGGADVYTDVYSYSEAVLTPSRERQRQQDALVQSLPLLPALMVSVGDLQVVCVCVCM